MMGWSRAQAEQDVVAHKYVGAVNARDGQKNEGGEEPSMVGEYVLEELAGWVAWGAHVKDRGLKAD